MSIQIPIQLDFWKTVERFEPKVLELLHQWARETIIKLFSLSGCFLFNPSFRNAGSGSVITCNAGF